MSTARQRWLDEGLAILAEEGEQGLRIDRLAARLSLTKGSFFHHFGGAAAYRAALLEHYERATLAAVADAMETAGETDPRAVLAALTERATEDDSAIRRTKLDLAVRAWATSDAEARATQARIDAAIVAALQRTWRPAVESDAAARTAALVPYLVSLGAAVIVPPIEADELKDVYELLLRAVPSVPGDGSR